MRPCASWIRGLRTGTLAAGLLLFHVPVHSGINQWTSNGPYGGSVSVLVADPKAPAVMYAAGVSGIFKTIDGALTWSRASNGITDPTVTAIAIDPVTTSIVYAGSIHGGRMIKSTDGGATWSPLATGPTLVIAMAIPAQSPSTIYAAQQQSGILKSNDGGATWNKVGVATLPAFPTFTSIIVDPANSGTLYAGETSKGVYKSTDGGGTWAAANTGFTTGSVIQVVKLAIDPLNPSTLYAAANTSTSAGLYKSTNGGASWTQVFTDTSGIIGVQAVAVDPVNSAIVYMGTFGQGLRKSVDGAATFAAANAGLPKVGVNAIVLNPASSANVLVGTENGVFASIDSGAGWTSASHGLALVTVNAVAVDPQAPTTVYAATSRAGLWKSVDGGDSWQAINGGIGATGNLACNSPNFATLAIDPATPSTIYAGTQCTLDSQVYRSINGGADWTVTSTGLPPFGNVSSLAVDPQSPATVYAGTTAQGLYVSGDGGAHWAASPFAPASAHVSAVSVVGPLTGASGSSAVGVATEGEGAFIGNAASQDPAPPAKSVVVPIPVSDRCLGLFHEMALDPRGFLDGSDRHYLGYLACVATATGNYLGFTIPTPSPSSAKALPDPVEWGAPDGNAAKIIACAPVSSIVLDPADATRFHAASACGALTASGYGAQMATLNAGLPANVALNAMAATPSGSDLYAGSTASGAWKYTPSSIASPVTVVEYYNAALDHYFITWVSEEIAKLDAGTTIKGWTRTNESFKAYTSAQAATSPVCRYYIPPGLGDSHFFGRGTVECVATGQKNPSFVQESSDFMQMFLPAAGVCPANTTNIYRVFSNRPDANHRYMTSKAIRDQMVAKGWLVEGDGPDSVVMCAPM